MDNKEFAGVAFSEYKDSNGFKRSITARGDSVMMANTALEAELARAIALGAVPYERPAFTKREAKPMRDVSAGCAECGEPVSDERKTDWNGKQWWTRDCASGQRHKTGFFRQAA